MEPIDYTKAIEQIKARFPVGTVQTRNDNQNAYIPNQVYIDRVEKATSSQWSREVRDVEINVPHGYVKVIVRVTIGDYFRDGIGFSEIDKNKSIANKIDLATAEALREALDTWQIGWMDLAPHYQGAKDWGSNPALRHLLASAPGAEGNIKEVQSHSLVPHQCIYTGCGKQLSRDEWEFLTVIPGLNLEKMKYCFQHIPNHLKKRAPQDQIEKYETRIQRSQ